MHRLNDNLLVVAQQQGVNTQHCFRNRYCLQWYQSRASNEALQQCVQNTDLSDLSLNRWLDDAAMLQDANRVSCQVTVVVVVTDTDTSTLR